MNRAERRKAAKEQRNNNIRRNTNSKHNFVDMGKWDIPINELKQDENTGNGVSGHFDIIEI